MVFRTSVGSGRLSSRRLLGAAAVLAGVICASFLVSVPHAGAATKAPQIIKIEAGAVRYEPRTITVTVGQPVVLRITNTSTIDHEALLGDEKVQKAHAAEMKDAAAMGHDMASHGATTKAKPGEGFTTIAPKKTAEIRTMFTKVGRTILGCHLKGHYEGGMRLTVIVKPKALGAA